MGAFINCLFAQFRRWMRFCDPHVLFVHCGSQNASALNLNKNPNYYRCPNGC